MLPIILFILKLLGILVLILLGLVLGVLLLILFVPVRYRIEGSYYERLKGKVRVTWLLHIVSVTAAYETSSPFSSGCSASGSSNPWKRAERMRKRCWSTPWK